MLLSGLLQRRDVWQFDLRSALVGALLAWIIAGLAYSQRETILRIARAAWEPIAAWRRRVRSSQEEKYAKALQQALRRLLLFEPANPDLTFLPPTFLAPAPLPATVAEVAQSPRIVSVTFAALLTGHRQLVIVGPQGSGRTTALVMSVWQAVNRETHEGTQPYTRLPVYIDLSAVGSVTDRPKASALERIVGMATSFMPGIAPAWLQSQLRREPSLMLLDNWDVLSARDRVQVAGWIAEANERMPDAVWLVASGVEGYGCLVEGGFVPVELVLPVDDGAIAQLYRGWQKALGVQTPPVTDSALDEDDGEANVIGALETAARAGSPVWELHLRSRLHLRTGELPDRPVEVLAQHLDTEVGAVELSRGSEPIAEQARRIALQTLVSIAAMERFQGHPPTVSELRNLVEAQLPPKKERPRRLDAAVSKILSESGMLRREERGWRVAHRIWLDYLAAIHLAEDESGPDLVQSHLHDPQWGILTEFYAGIADVSQQIQDLINRSEIYGDRDALLRAARWGAVGDADQPWRKDVTKALAKTFMSTDLELETRLALGRALAVVAGESTRAFFLRVLRSPSHEVQCAALRGLGWIGAPRDMAILAAALRDSAPDLRRSAVRALRDLNTPGAIAFLGETLPSSDETLMLDIANALAESAEGAVILEEATRHPDLLVRRSAALGLGRIAADWARDRLLEIAREDNEWLVRSAADTALLAHEERAERQIKVSPPPAVDSMDWLIAWAARQGLGLGVGDAAMAMLVRAAQEGNVDAKVLSALTLAQIGREDDARVLEPLQTAPDPDVQQAATWALRRIRQRYTVYEGG